MRFCTIDLETLYGDQIPHGDLDPRYTLSSMSTESYIRDPRFRAHGAAIKWGEQPARWYNEPELRKLCAETDWSDVFLLAHHANFDLLILSHHYNVHPKMRGDTLSMARLLLGNHISVSLESVRKEFGIPPKTTPYNLFKGKTWDEMTPQIHQQLAAGCVDECESVWTIFKKMLVGFSPEELETIDITISMFTEPCLRADVELLADIWEHEANEKQSRLQRLNITEKDLQSAAKFQALLEAQGVDIEYKQGKKGPIPAFAANDSFMQQLLEDPDVTVRTLAEARLAVKSTLLQTRAASYAAMAGRGFMCVYLRMYGAHTTRWSGGDSTNFQNLTKSDPDFAVEDGGLNIRESLLAPEGFLLGAIDESQVECRLLNKIAGQEDVIERFRRGEDPYINVASQFYGFEVNKKDHPKERNVGKVLELQAGYQSGGDKIRATLRTKAGIILTKEEGVRARDAYRSTHPFVVKLWDEGKSILPILQNGETYQWGPALVKDHRIWLPNGTALQYDSIEYYHDNESGDKYWRVKKRAGWTKLYGGKLVENLIQALARVVISQAMIRIHRLGYKIVTTTHDEILVLIPKDGNEQRHLEICKAEMRKTPDWLPGLPLDCDAVLSERYAK